MSNINSNNRDSLEKFNNAFIGFLTKENFLKKKLDDFDDKDIKTIFPEKDKLWLQKEVSKWRRKINDHTFHGTLQSLQILCNATKNTPNDVLLPNLNNLFTSGNIEILSIEDIKYIFKCIQENPKGFIKICIDNGCLPLQIPIFYSPKNFSVTFLYIKQCRHTIELDSLDTCFITYEYYMTDFIKNKSNGTEEVVIKSSYKLNWLRLTSLEFFEKLEGFHKDIIDLNEQQTTIYDEAIFEDCGKILKFLLKNNTETITGKFFKMFPTENLCEPEFNKYDDNDKSSVDAHIKGKKVTIIKGER